MHTALPMGLIGCLLAVTRAVLAAAPITLVDDGKPAPGETLEPDARTDQKTVPPKAPKADDEWARYVRAFIAKYHLNDEQQQRAWLIYGDAKERDDVFGGRFERQMETLRRKADSSKGGPARTNGKASARARALVQPTQATARSAADAGPAQERPAG